MLEYRRSTLSLLVSNKKDLRKQRPTDARPPATSCWYHINHNNQIQSIIIIVIIIMPPPTDYIKHAPPTSWWGIAWLRHDRKEITCKCLPLLMSPLPTKPAKQNTIHALLRYRRVLLILSSLSETRNSRCEDRLRLKGQLFGQYLAPHTYTTCLTHKDGE